ncbi:uncharacterized protein LOC128619635 [Ictalurus furcatus]|uniref:uncharacterized protein LOC128619635 n=1 Tax=Ictalurus furcatus TaxID=66913 RepID=UPI0023504860|nr:uncharacterized protein LOC128619635 [Ictalurus furcatus]
MIKEKMSQSCVHLIAFALVAVLCVCMVTDVSGFTTENNMTSDSLRTTAESVSNYLNDTEESETVNTTASPDTSPPHSNNTHTNDHSNEKHSEHITNTMGSTTMGSTTMGSTTMGSTTMGSTTMASTTMASTTTTSRAMTSRAMTSSPGPSGKAAGIFFLILIFIIIVILAVILYILWKKGKRYSFDLTISEHDTPLRSMEHTGTFEQTKGSTMNLDYIKEDNPNKTNPVANGCSGETADQTPCSEQQSGPEEDSFTSDLSLSSPVKKVEFNLDLELIGGEPEPVKQATDETPTDNDNENNNNDTDTGNDSADHFTEINLDDTQ